MQQEWNTMEELEAGYHAFKRVLTAHHITTLDRMSDREKREIYYVFANNGFFTWDSIYDIINGAKKKNMLSTLKYASVDVADLAYHAFSRADIDLYKQLNAIDQIFKGYFKQNGIKNTNYTQALRYCWKVAQDVNGINNDLTRFTKESVDTLYVISLLYSEIVNHLENKPIKMRVRITNAEGKAEIVEKQFERLADYIISNRLERIKHSITLLTPEKVENFGKFLDEITSEANEKEQFSKDEVFSLLKKSMSIINYATAEKYTTLKDMLNTYFDTVKAQATDTTSEAYTEFEKVTLKSIMLRCGTVLNNIPEVAQFALNLTTGKTMYECFDEIKKTSVSKNSLVYKNIKALQESYPRLKVSGLDTESHLYFITQRMASIPRLHPSTVLESTNMIVDVTLQGLGQNIDNLTVEQKRDMLVNLGFNINNFYNKDNYLLIPQIAGKESGQARLTPQQEAEKLAQMTKNVEIISKYVKPEGLHSILAHNLNILFLDSEALYAGIEHAVKQSKGNKEVFSKLFHEIINAEIELQQTAKQPKKRASSTPRVELEIDEAEEDAFEAPEREYINVDIVGFEEKKQPVKPKSTQVKPEPQKELIFTECYNSIFDEILELKMYAGTSSEEELKKVSSKFGRPLAQMIAKLSLSGDNYKSRNQAKLDNFEALLTDIEVYKEFDADSKKYLLQAIAETVEMLTLRKELLQEDKKSNNAQTDEFYATERDKNSRSTKQIRKSMEKLSLTAQDELATEGEVGTMLRTLIQQRLQQLQEDKDILDIANEEVAVTRRKDTKEHKKLKYTEERAIIEGLEIEYIDKIIASLHTAEKVLTRPSAKQVETFDTSELRAEIDRLKTEREQKLKSLAGKFAIRFKYHDFDLEQDMDEIVGDSAFGRRLVKNIRNIESQIAKLEQTINNRNNVSV